MNSNNAIFDFSISAVDHITARLFAPSPCFLCPSPGSANGDWHIVVILHFQRPGCCCCLNCLHLYIIFPLAKRTQRFFFWFGRDVIHFTRFTQSNEIFFFSAHWQNTKMALLISLSFRKMLCFFYPHRFLCFRPAVMNHPTFQLKCICSEVKSIDSKRKHISVVFQSPTYWQKKTHWKWIMRCISTDYQQ